MKITITLTALFFIVFACNQTDKSKIGKQSEQYVEEADSSIVETIPPLPEGEFLSILL